MKRLSIFILCVVLSLRFFSSCGLADDDRAPTFEQMGKQVALLKQIDPELGKEMTPLLQKHKGFRSTMQNRSDPVSLKSKTYIFQEALTWAAYDSNFDEHTLRTQYPALTAISSFKNTFKIARSSIGMLFVEEGKMVLYPPPKNVDELESSIVSSIPEFSDSVTVIRGADFDSLVFLSLNTRSQLSTLQTRWYVIRAQEWISVKEDDIPVPRDAAEKIVTVDVENLTQGYKVGTVKYGLFGRVTVIIEHDPDLAPEKGKDAKLDLVIHPNVESGYSIDGVDAEGVIRKSVAEKGSDTVIYSASRVASKKSTSSLDLREIVQDRQIARGKISVTWLLEGQKSTVIASWAHCWLDSRSH